MKRKILALLLAAALSLGLLTGCGGSSSAAASGSSTAGHAGTYEGTGAGRNGDIVVAVTLDDTGAITDIQVKENTETEGIGTLAFDQMIPLMVANNTVAVDTVATATLTSDGLLEAVRNALEAAGVDLANYASKVEAAQGEDTVYNVDVVIVGGGGAGMAAAA